MATSEENRQKIQLLGHDELVALWARVVAGTDTPEWDEGMAMEYLIPRAFELEGAEIAWPFQVREENKVLEQIDGVIYSDGLACVLQTKNKADAVNFEPIAKLKQQIARRPLSTIGVCFSTNGFTDEARIVTELAAPQNIVLWDGPELGYALEHWAMRKGLVAKYRYLVEMAKTDGFIPDILE